MTKPKSNTKAASTSKAVTAARKATTEQKVETAATQVGASLSEADIAEARRQGAIEAEKQAAKDSYTYATDGNLPGNEPVRTFPGHDDIMQYEPLLHIGIEGLEAAIAANAPAPVPEEKVYGLLGLERNGQNRTPYVKAMIKRLGLKEGDPLPGGGPGYTNDVHPVSDLFA